MTTFVHAPTVTVLGSYPNPEGIAAGLARVSRSTTPIPTLVQEASINVELARTRNQKIIYDYGHSSIAEHAAFSIAIENIPRSLSLDIIQHRLASYTQLSYRYVNPPPERISFYLPEEYTEPRLQSIVQAASDHARTSYGEVMRLLVAQEMAGESPPTESVATRRATEDARYILPIAQTTTIGMTANARVWGYVISTLRAGPHSEHHHLGTALSAALHPLAPSLFPEQYLGPCLYEQRALAAVREERGVYASWGTDGEWDLPTHDGVTLVRYDAMGERVLAEALLIRTSGLNAIDRTMAMADANPATLIPAASTGLGAYDRVLREFELVCYTFEIVCSEACLHQLLRHRMATHLPQPRTLRLSTTPPRIAACPEAAHLYHQSLRICEDAYRALGETSRASLLLCSGHNRRTVLHLNARELIEMTRLRTDPTAQWEIREKVTAMQSLVATVHPSLAPLMGGRRTFKTPLTPP